MQRILIIGRKGHGKTTFAGFLKQALGDAQTFSTSEYLVHRLALIHGTTEAKILAAKERYRPEMIVLGNAMCDVDPGCLVSICLWACHKECAIIDGIRRVSEYKRVRKWFEHVLWIERPGIPEGLDNLELTHRHAQEIIVNDGSLADLREKARRYAAAIQRPRARRKSR